MSASPIYAKDPKALNVHSCAFDDESSEWIQCNCPTDALVAKLHLESRVPARYVDAFLRVLHNPLFDAKQLSFQTSADIDRSIAEYRRARALKRASACAGFPSTRLPYDVFALVVNTITCERLPLRTDDPTSVFGKLQPGRRHPDRIASRLKALALTHRALTPLAQRALGQRLFVQKADDLRALTRSPLLGPWTTELLINLHFTSLAGRELSRPEEVLDCVAAILRRAPGLRFLRIRTLAYLEEASSPSLRGLLEAISTLEQIETLWLIAPENASHFARVDLEDMCRIVSGMPHLRRLVLRNAQCGWKEFNEVNDGTHHLEELSLTDLTCTAGPLEGTCLRWPLKSTTIRSLTLGLNTGNQALESLLASSSAMPQLETLRLKLTRQRSPQFFSQIFSYSSGNLSSARALNLHELHLSCEDALPDALPLLAFSDLLKIPSSVRVLRLGFFHLTLIDELGRERCSEQEFNVIRFVDEYFDESRGRRLDELEIILPIQQNCFSWRRLRDLCEARGCRCAVRKVMQPGFA